MSSIVNLEETIGRTVGKRQAPVDPLLSSMRTADYEEIETAGECREPTLEDLKKLCSDLNEAGARC